MTTVLFAGGGTGGHLMPALAIADAMVALDPTIQPFFVGSERGVESRVLPVRPWRHVLLPFEPIRRRQWWKNARLPLSLYRSLMGVFAVLKREQPALVVGTGGYVAGPTLWAAAQRGLPIVLQEQNAYPGLATRHLAPRARQIHLGFPEAARYLKPGAQTRVLESGNPIVPPPEPRPERSHAKQRLGFSPSDRLVVVVGGSQGAMPVNRAVAAWLDQGLEPGVALLWQSGEGPYAEFARYNSRGRCRVEPFIDPMADAYAAADIVVARSGAMTLAELAAWGLPAILVPLPTAAAGHQLGNALALARTGAAVVLEQPRLAAGTLAGAISDLLAGPARMADMTRAMLSRGRPLAARAIGTAALELVAIR